jgi:hypothetical protein
MPRPKLNALPQDSVLRAHLRRQADWPDDAPRLTRRDTGKRQRRELLDAVDRIGRANHLAGQAEARRAAAEALRASAEVAGYAMQPDVADEIGRLEREADDLAGQARAMKDDSAVRAPETSTPGSAARKKAGRPGERGRATAARAKPRGSAGRP